MAILKFKVIKRQNNHSRCFVCGTLNESGLHARFYECEAENGDKVLVGEVVPRDNHQSYPHRAHGGITAALLDESIGRAAKVVRPEIWGVTVDLSVRYRNPVPLNEKVYVVAKAIGFNSRFFEGEGKLYDSKATLCATASARYFNTPPEMISAEVTSEENWFDTGEPCPDQIIIGE